MVITKSHLINHYYSRDGLNPFLIILHIAEGNAQQVDSTFKYEEKSSNYFVLKNGDVIEYVPEELAAWTQGIIDRPTARLVKEWLKENPYGKLNKVCLSIEHEGYGHEDITPEQKFSTLNLIKSMCKKWNIPTDREHILRHQEINLSKTCPGKLNVDKIVSELQMDNKLENAICKDLEEENRDLKNQLADYKNTNNIIIRLYSSLVKWGKYLSGRS